VSCRLTDFCDLGIFASGMPKISGLPINVLAGVSDLCPYYVST